MELSCPICSLRSFESLQELEWHLSEDHPEPTSTKAEGNPFTFMTHWIKQRTGQALPNLLKSHVDVLFAP